MTEATESSLQIYGYKAKDTGWNQDASTLNIFFFLFWKWQGLMNAHLQVNVNNGMFYSTEEISRCGWKRMNNHAALTYQLWVTNSVFCNDSRRYKRCQLQEPTRINLHTNEPGIIGVLIIYFLLLEVPSEVLSINVGHRGYGKPREAAGQWQPHGVDSPR